MQKEFYDYIVYSDGRVYSKKLGRFLKASTVAYGYKHVALRCPQQKIWKLHRLVAYCFCNPPENWKDLVVNHIDGDKTNNDYTNLEWCSAWYNNFHARKTGLNDVAKSNSDRWKNKEFREKTIKNMSKAFTGNRSREKNGEWRYDIRDKYGRKYTRNDIMRITGKALSTISMTIREVAHGGRREWLDKHGIIVIDTRKKSQSTIESISAEKDGGE